MTARTQLGTVTGNCPLPARDYEIKAFDALSFETKALAASGEIPTRAQCIAVLADLVRLGDEGRRTVLRAFPAAMVHAIAEEWWWQAHGGQREPPPPWSIWSIVAARGFGKTRAGAEWVWARARGDGDGAGDSLSGCPPSTAARGQPIGCPPGPPSDVRIALVAATFDEVERVMVRGESGLLAIARGHEKPRWIPSRRVLVFPSGAEAHAFSAERPESLRGPQHHFAWCDELAKWPASTGAAQDKAEETWNNLMLGLRLGEEPRTIVTTTPRPVPLLRRILALPGCVATHGRTADNPHLPASFIAAMREQFAGTRLARQELEGELLENFEGALWTRELIEKARDSHFHAPAREDGKAAPESDCPHLARREEFQRIVLGLDPPASTGGDSCGIVVCGMDREGIAYVLADLTAAGLGPEAWARRVAEAAALYGASRVVAEKNQGGDMIASVLRAVDANLPVRLVPATRSKAARAEPIALRFETGQARLAGNFPDLEDQMCALTWQGYQGQGSPDRLDAMVWAMTELFEKARAGPRVRGL